MGAEARLNAQSSGQRATYSDAKKALWGSSSTSVWQLLSLFRQFVELACVGLIAQLAVCDLLGAQELDSSPTIEFDREIRPILARRCFACHGPDAEQRQGGLRLDSPEGIRSPSDSGRAAVVPNDPSGSLLMERVQSDADERMPPTDHGPALNAVEIKKLQRWIAQGALWSEHFAFRSLTSQLPPLPSPRIDDELSPIDAFLQRRRAELGIKVPPKADRAVLIRRLYLDVLGVPPTAAEVQAFEEDKHPAAWNRQVDRVLASPLYGQRWGRHWLDVARYGDSNGGDENHAYPYASRYRDWTIKAMNGDLPFNDFVRWQLMGDLVEEIPDGFSAEDPSLATGFLALGTKILAEKDEVKKQADTVDEQIDATGRAFLGLTLGCARCHDHKFDPVTQADYYALAGVFHSSMIVMDGEIETPGLFRERRSYVAKRNALAQGMEALNKRLEEASSKSWKIQAEDFDRGNVVVDSESYGKGIGIISDPGGQKNFVEYDLTLPRKDQYIFRLRYAAEIARPGKLFVDGRLVTETVMVETTGGWFPEHQRWFHEAKLELASGKHTLRIESEPNMSHLDQLQLIGLQDLDANGAWEDELADLQAQRLELEKQQPQGTVAMLMREGTPRDVAIHVRGSHLDLGETIPRGPPRFLDQAVSSIQNRASGRSELAAWIVDPDRAGMLTSRVIVNRLWHWHFGRGLVASTDDFGLQASPLKHPELLDFLSSELIRKQWSLKRLHYDLITSGLYQATSVAWSEAGSKNDPGNLTWWHWQPRRLDAETLRDVMLFHAGRLDTGLQGTELNVKSQDPSPEDLRQNLEAYQNFRRRSVYLPVVRSNTYAWLTLFDFPNASTCVGRRNLTTVPTQALLLLNDSSVMSLAEEVARLAILDVEHQLENGGTSEAGESSRTQLVTALFSRLLGRSPSSSEVEVLLDLLVDGEREVWGKADVGEVPAKLIALAHVLLISNESFYLR